LTNTKLGLLRHGQTDWNIQFLLQGVTDIPMNETGLLQAKSASKAIVSTEWDLILTSPLSRARQTAEIVAATGGFPDIEVEELLLERSFGEAEGLSHEQWKDRYKNLDEIPGGESVSALTTRSQLLLDTILERYAGKSILAVSHGAFIRKVLEAGSQGEFPREGERLGNASLNIVEHFESRWQVTKYDLEPLA
jgi:broad specificity phosphatase PhoE